MNCREFRQKHDSYLDDTLKGAEIDGMQHHLRFCETCARHDTRIRRALIVARNVPMIRPSADFSARLQARLREESMNGRSIQRVRAESIKGFTPGAYIVIATGVLMIAGLAGVVMLPGEPQAVHMAPVIATAPLPESTAPTTFPMTIVADVPTGIPAWPASYLAPQASWRLVADQGSR